MYRISLCNPMSEGVGFGDRQIPSLLFADDVVLLVSLYSDLQPSLGWFAAECEAVGMIISTSKSKGIILSRKRVDCPLQVGGESHPQMEEFKYLLVLFMREGRQEQETDRRIGPASAVMRTLKWSIVVRRELRKKAKLSIYKQPKSASFTGWLSVRDRVRSSDIQERLRVELLLLHVERS